VFGGLYQLDAPNDCLSGQAGGCGTTLPFATGFGYEPVVSPDGRNVYYIALVGSIGEYARDQSTGALTTIGCVTGNAVPGCTPINNAGLNGPAAAAFSPDGKNLYVATQGDQAVVTFSRDTSTGLLTFTGCIGEGGGSSCPTNTGKGIATPYGIVVSPDGKNVYVSSAQDQAVSEFDRNPSTGGLTQKASPNDCITALASGCGTINAPGLQATIGIAVSPDSANVYVLAGGTGGTGQGDIAEFSRSASTGVLSQLGGGNACLGAPGAPAGCATTATALQGIEDMALSPDGRFAYANSFITSSLVTLTRAANGALAQSDCISSQAGSPAGCSAYNVPGMQGPLGVAISPDADTVYVSGALANGEAAFQRNSSTGHLTALPGPFNCITLDPSACGQSGASGLEWLTADYCDGTGITVYRDVVRVTNLHTHKSVNVRAGHSVFVTKA
jgi:DNA-binding beta-propeller fold protein YncE